MCTFRECALNPSISRREVIDCILDNALVPDATGLWPWGAPAHVAVDRILQAEEAYMCAYRLREDYTEPPFVREFIVVENPDGAASSKLFFAQRYEDVTPLSRTETSHKFDTYIKEKDVKYDYYVAFSKGDDDIGINVDDTFGRRPAVTVESIDSSFVHTFQLTRMPLAEAVLLYTRMTNMCISQGVPAATCNSLFRTLISPTHVIYKYESDLDLTSVHLGNGYCDGERFNFNITAYDDPASSLYPPYRLPDDGRLDGGSRTRAYALNVATWDGYEEPPHTVRFNSQEQPGCVEWTIDSHCDEDRFIYDLDPDPNWPYRIAEFHCYTDLVTDPPGELLGDPLILEQFYIHSVRPPDHVCPPPPMPCTFEPISSFISRAPYDYGMDVDFDYNNLSTMNIDWDGFNEMRVEMLDGDIEPIEGDYRFFYRALASNGFITASDQGSFVLEIRRQPTCGAVMQHCSITDLTYIDLDYGINPYYPIPFHILEGRLEDQAGRGMPDRPVYVRSLAVEPPSPPGPWTPFDYFTMVRTIDDIIGTPEDESGTFLVAIPSSELCDPRVRIPYDFLNTFYKKCDLGWRESIGEMSSRKDCLVGIWPYWDPNL